MRRTVARYVKRAKNDWFQWKVREVEDKVMRGMGAWKVLGTFKEGGLICCLLNLKQLKILMVSFVLLQQTVYKGGSNISILF